MKKTLLICIMCLVAALCLCLSACNPEHTHSFTSGDYKSTASGHSQKCTGCDEYGEEEAHDFGADGKCTVCGFEHEHNFAADDFQTSENGHKQKCTDCNQYGPEQAHTFGTDGKKCTVCGYEKKDTEPTEHKHNLTKVPAKEPTCTAEGNIEYYTCDGENCKGKYFDANGRELEEKSVVVAKKDHDFTSKKFDINADGHKQKCANCDTYSEREDHEFGEDGKCEVCGYDPNTKEELVLPDNLDGEYKNALGGTITIDGTSVDVEIEIQLQQQQSGHYTIIGYDEETGKLTLSPAFDLTFNEETQTLFDGTFTYVKEREFELPSELDGIYVNNEGKEIIVDNDEKTVQFDEESVYFIVYYDDGDLTLSEMILGTIVKMTYDEKEDKITYDSKVYTKKTGGDEDDDKIELPDTLTGDYYSDSEDKITVLRDSLQLQYTKSGEDMKPYKIVDYKEGKISLTPVVKLPGDEDIEMDYDAEHDKITYGETVFTKKSEGGEGGGEQGDDPSTTLPESIYGEYKNEEGSTVTIDKDTDIVTLTVNNFKMTFEVRDCSSGNITLMGTDAVANMPAKMIYEEEEKTIEFIYNVGTEYERNYGTFNKVEEGDKEDIVEEFKKACNGEYTYRTTFSMTVSYPTLSYNNPTTGATTTFTILEETISTNSFSAKNDASATDVKQGTWSKETGITLFSGNVCVKQKTETDNPKDPVESETPETPEIDVPEEWKGIYYHNNEGKTLEIGDKQVIYKENSSSSGETHEITAVDKDSLTISVSNGTRKLTYDDEKQTFTDNNWGLFYFEPEDVESLLPEDLAGTYKNGSNEMVITGTKMTVGSTVLTIVNYVDGLIILKKESGFHTTATYNESEKSIVYSDNTYKKEPSAAAANISEMSELFIIDKAVAPIAYTAFKKN